MNYKQLLNHSYEHERINSGDGCQPETKLAYLSESIFNFVTYDKEKDELFGRKAVEVCLAINNNETFDFIKDPDNYTWFLVMCNMPFFSERIEWGTSLRGAWWGGRCGVIELQSCGLWSGNKQLTGTLSFTNDEWRDFISAMGEFVQEEMIKKREGL